MKFEDYEKEFKKLAEKHGIGDEGPKSELARNLSATQAMLNNLAERIEKLEKTIMNSFEERLKDMEEIIVDTET